MGQAVVLGQIALSFHAAAAAVVAELLRELGHEVILKEAPHEKMYEMHRAGEVDLVCSAWLPASHEVYLNPYLDQVEKLSVIYEPYCIWGISPDAPAEIKSVADLPNHADKIRKLVQGINPGAGISRFSRQMIEDYGLSSKGYHFENGSLDDCTGAFLDAQEAGDLAVVPLWHPQWLHSQVTLRELEDPKGLLGGQDDATLVIRKDALPKVNAAGMRMLRNIYLGNAEVSKLDFDICKGGKTHEVAASDWIASHRAQVDRWFKEA